MGDKTVLVCDCAGTMPLDGDALAKACGAESCSVNRLLCRDQVGRVADAARSADGPLLIACTQEGAAFEEALEEAGIDADISLVNIRERAGWSDDAKSATPKIAALLAEAALDAPDVTTVEMVSGGICLVYGSGQVALDAARQLNDRMTVSLLFKDIGDVIPLGMMDIMAAKGRIAAASGHLGDFEINVNGYAGVNPNSRDGFGFGLESNGAAAKCDIILDLTGEAPPFPHHEKRDGYLRADPNDPVAVQKAVFKASDMVGEFEKPRYVDFKTDLCAHSRSKVTGCTRCLDVCPAGAIQPDGDTVAIDPYLCGGCGSCNSVCPTGAASYAYPPSDFLLTRARTLLTAHAEAGGARPLLLVHSQEEGTNQIEAMARFGRGLPARALPMAVHEPTVLGAEFMLSAVAYGAERVFIAVPSKRRAELDGLAQQVGLAVSILTGLGHESGRIIVIVEDDPDAIETALWDAPKPGGNAIAASAFIPQPEKRTNMRLAAEHLRQEAGSDLESIALPPGSAFGRVNVDVDGCTLCLACVGACPKPGGNAIAASAFIPQPEKRTNMRLAAEHLRQEAGSDLESIALPPGSAFGRVNVDVDGCTLRLACVGACPTNALGDNPDMPQLSFQESACIQCGLCKNTCPEKVITLEPRYRFGEKANDREVVKEEEPFECVSCGKPFASKSTIEKMVETLGDKHWMFQGEGIERLKMCEDCRVQAVFNEDDPYLASGKRPLPRTTDDYIAARDR